MVYHRTNFVQFVVIWCYSWGFSGSVRHMNILVQFLKSIGCHDRLEALFTNEDFSLQYLSIVGILLMPIQILSPMKALFSEESVSVHLGSCLPSDCIFHVA
ncbi:hypothetical protein DPMN_159360 [Dreissena polymorpha]|uniref:Uncharacterized protein n=1 Tax=Dreissena polymorpha TaxID=45954 RepID=A0A9D4ELE5_DREPO|nr:hypothetical protein DPMN_159360 [Dreissena polymorpha]